MHYKYCTVKQGVRVTKTPESLNEEGIVMYPVISSA